MRGVTNAVPAGGGLKVIAEGTVVGSQTIDLPAPAKIAYVCVINAESQSSRQWAVVTPQQSVGDVADIFHTWFPSSTQLSMFSAMGFTYYYLVLG